MKSQNTSYIEQNKDIVGVAVVTFLALMVPFISMVFTGEMLWDHSDFIVVAVLVGGIGSLFVVLSRMVRTTQQKIIIGAILAFVVLWLWAELAVGLFTNWGS